MSFNLSRTQFLQMFAVMQSIKLINSHTAKSGAPALFWKNDNINAEQFAVLTSLLSSTPSMPKLTELPSGSTAPILINPFVEGGYLPHSGPGFVAISETGALNINENALFGAMEPHISAAFTNLTRHVNARAVMLRCLELRSPTSLSSTIHFHPVLSQPDSALWMRTESGRLLKSFSPTYSARMRERHIS